MEKLTSPCRTTYLQANPMKALGLLALASWCKNEATNFLCLLLLISGCPPYFLKILNQLQNSLHEILVI